jgi:ferritin heavy chain
MSKLPNNLVEALHDHLTLELEAFYFYWAASTKFKSIYTSYPGFAKYFQAESDEEKSHAQQIIDFLIKRGYNVKFPGFLPFTEIGKDPLKVLEQSSIKEDEVLISLQNLYNLGQNCIDLSSFLEGMIVEQQTAISKLHQMINELTTLTSDSYSIGLYLYDQKLLNY